MDYLLHGMIGMEEIVRHKFNIGQPVTFTLEEEEFRGEVERITYIQRESGITTYYDIGIPIPENASDEELHKYRCLCDYVINRIFKENELRAV